MNPRPCTTPRTLLLLLVLTLSLLAIGGLSSRPASAQPAADSLRTFHENGGWCWFQDERVIVADSTLVLASVAGTTRAGIEAGDVYVTAYDLVERETTSTELHDQLGRDDHNTPALLLRPNGQFLAAYSRHGADSFLRTRLTRSPDNVDAWTPEQTFSVPGSGLTYTNLHYLPRAHDDGRIYNFSRAKGADPTWMFSDDGGQTWTWGGQVLQWPGRPYVKYASNARSIHLATTDGHPRQFANDIYHGYLRGDTLYDSHGTALQSLDEGPLARKSLTKVFDGDPHNVAWTTDVHLNEEGHPVMGFSVQKDGASFRNDRDAGPGWDHRYYYARFDGAEWHVHEMAYAGTGLYPREADYTGLLAIDPNQPNVVYISTDVHPVTGLPNVSDQDGDRHYEIYKGVTDNGGRSWTWTAVTQNSTADHLRPVIPDWEGSRRAILWMRGQYRSYTNYDTDIVGRIEKR